MRTCAVLDCDKPPRSGKAELCKMHYHRQYRHGSVHARAFSTQKQPNSEYRRVYRPGHPISGKRGMTYAHRVNLYDKIGPGEHGCHWCGKTVSWDGLVKAGDKLEVDHLNNDKTDNDPANLVPACRSCNTTRGRQEHHRKLVEAGMWAGSDTIARTKVGRRAEIVTPVKISDHPPAELPR